MEMSTGVSLLRTAQSLLTGRTITYVTGCQRLLPHHTAISYTTQLEMLFKKECFYKTPGWEGAFSATHLTILIHYHFGQFYFFSKKEKKTAGFFPPQSKMG